MAQYRMLEKAFLNHRIYDVSEVADVPDDTVPGSHMVPVDDAAKKMAKKVGLKNGPLPDPIDDLTKTREEAQAAQEETATK